jgi:HK97 gp10 family phage protein
MAKNSGLASLNRRLKAIPAAVKEAVQPALGKAGEDLAADMRRLAEASRDSGELIESITVTPAGQRTPPYSQPGGEQVVPENAVMVTAGNTKVRYAHLVEYGTTAAEAQPFFWPAVRLNRKKVTGRIKRAVSKAVKTAR